MLTDSSPTVRGNAALSLVRFSDASGREQIVALLQPAHLIAPLSGHIIDADRPGTAIHQGGIIAKLGYGHEQTMEIRSPISGRIHSIFATTGATVAAGTEIAIVAHFLAIDDLAQHGDFAFHRSNVSLFAPSPRARGLHANSMRADIVRKRSLAPLPARASPRR